MIIGPPYTHNLEDRVIRAKTPLSRLPVSEENRVLHGSVIPTVGVGGGDDHRSTQYGLARRPGRQDEDGLKRFPTSGDNGTFVGLRSRQLRWVGVEDIGLHGVGDLEGRVVSTGRRTGRQNGPKDGSPERVEGRVARTGRQDEVTLLRSS